MNVYLFSLDHLQNVVSFFGARLTVKAHGSSVP